MRYLPHTRDDIQQMLAAIGVSELEDLFAMIPEACCRLDGLDLPAPLTEWELDEHMDDLAGRNATPPESKLFIGAGSYHHFIPEVVRQLRSRSEFYTAYTPYQPEISQGTLQAVYEYQTLAARLLGLDVANASMYDGASALAEALLMAVRITRRTRVAVSGALHPAYRAVIETYFHPTGYEVVDIPVGADGRVDVSALDAPDTLAGIAIQSPNFFGCIEDIASIASRVHDDPKCLLIVSFTEALAYGLLKNPGSLGADVACGEGQSLGNPQSFGGPGLGVFAAKKAYMRHMPGRLVGKTTDLDGKPGFVLTLSTREQHIRREKATSNICSNQGLCATTAAIYMAALGKTGMRELARLNYDKAEYLKNALMQNGFKEVFTAPTFNEFVLKCPPGFEDRRQELMQKKIVAGLPLKNWDGRREDQYLFCVTETAKKDDLDARIREVTS